MLFIVRSHAVQGNTVVWRCCDVAVGFRALVGLCEGRVLSGRGLPHFLFGSKRKQVVNFVHTPSAACPDSSRDK